MLFTVQGLPLFLSLLYRKVFILLVGRAGRLERPSTQMSISWKMWRLKGFCRSAQGGSSCLLPSHGCSFFCITSLPCLDCSKLTARNQSIDDHCRERFIFSPSTAAWLWALKKDPSSTSNQWCVLNLHESWLGLKPSRTLWGSPGYKSFSCPLFLSFFFF